MTTGAGACGWFMSRPIDTSITIDENAIAEIKTLFPYNDESFDEKYYVLMDNNLYGITTLDFREDGNVIALDGDDHNLICMPPSDFSGLTRKDIVRFWDTISLLEKYGWIIDRVEEQMNKYPNAIYGYPLPENRARFIRLLKKVYTVPMTKRAI